MSVNVEIKEKEHPQPGVHAKEKQKSGGGRKRKAPKQKGRKNRPRRSIVSKPVPAAINEFFKNTPAAMSSTKYNGFEGVRIKHREVIGTVLGRSTYTLTTYPINPGVATTFPWLHIPAKAYQSYVFHKFHVEYFNSCPTSTSGFLAFSPQYDPDLEPPASFEAALSFDDAIASSPWQPTVMRSSYKNLTKRKTYLVSTDSAPNRLEDVMALHMILNGQTNDEAAIGWIAVNYEVTLYSPVVNESESATDLEESGDASTTYPIPVAVGGTVDTPMGGTGTVANVALHSQTVSGDGVQWLYNENLETGWGVPPGQYEMTIEATASALPAAMKGKMGVAPSNPIIDFFVGAADIISVLDSDIVDTVYTIGSDVSYVYSTIMRAIVQVHQTADDSADEWATVGISNESPTDWSWLSGAISLIPTVVSLLANKKPGSRPGRFVTYRTGQKCEVIQKKHPHCVATAPGQPRPSVYQFNDKGRLVCLSHKELKPLHKIDSIEPLFSVKTRELRGVARLMDARSKSRQSLVYSHSGN
jgi:hypothetical protein